MTVSQIDPGIPRVPARQVILSAAALWLCYFLLITVRGLVVELGDFTDLLWRRGLVTAAGILVTVACWPLLRRFDGRSLAVRGTAALVIMLPAALALAAVNQWAFAPVEQRQIERISQTDPNDATTPGTADDRDPVTGVQIRHDMAGNVLVDVLDEPIISPPKHVPPVPAPPTVAQTPAPRSTASPKARATEPSDPGLDEETIAELEADGEQAAAEAMRNAQVVRNPMAAS